MMTCERAKAQLNNLIDGTLLPQQQSLLAGHLETCKGCKNEYNVLSAVVHLVRETPVADSTPSRERVITRFRQTVMAKDFVPRKAGFRIPFVPLGMAAAAVAGLTLLLILPQSNAPQMPNEERVESASMGSFPTSLELDRMARMHSARSEQEAAPNSELHSEAHSDAISRLADLSEDDSL